MKIRDYNRSIFEFPLHMRLLKDQIKEFILAITKFLDDYEEVTIDFTAINTEVTVKHHLDRIPNRWCVVKSITGATIFPSRIDEWTISRAYFKSNGANNTVIIKLWAKK